MALVSEYNDRYKVLSRFLLCLYFNFLGECCQVLTTNFLTLFLTYKKGGVYMPNMDNGRQKVLDYLKENNLTIATLAVQYNMARQDVTNILNGKLKNPQAHRFVARVIEDFKIR